MGVDEKSIASTFPLQLSNRFTKPWEPGGISSAFCGPHLSIRPNVSNSKSKTVPRPKKKKKSTSRNSRDNIKCQVHISIKYLNTY